MFLPKNRRNALQIGCQIDGLVICNSWDVSALEPAKWSGPMLLLQSLECNLTLYLLILYWNLTNIGIYVQISSPLNKNLMVIKILFGLKVNVINSKGVQWKVHWGYLASENRGEFDMFRLQIFATKDRTSVSNSGKLSNPASAKKLTANHHLTLSHKPPIIYLSQTGKCTTLNPREV